MKFGPTYVKSPLTEEVSLIQRQVTLNYWCVNFRFSLVHKFMKKKIIFPNYTV